MATLVFLCPSLDAKSMLRSIQNETVLGRLKVFIGEFTEKFLNATWTNDTSTSIRSNITTFLL